MNIAGNLNLKVVIDADRVAAVDITSTRPRAARLLAGKPFSAALALLPLLFTVCSFAQRLAGQAAVAAAQGQGPAPPPQRLALLCEATQEHLWRLLLDWPHLLGQAQMLAEFTTWFRRLALAGKSGVWPDWGDDFSKFVGDQVLGMRLDAWEQLKRFAPLRDGDSLAARLWHAAPELPAADQGAWLPAAPAATFAQMLDTTWDDAFERCPEWQGVPAETGTLVRWRDHRVMAPVLQRYGRGVRSRLLARMMDLAQCARSLQAAADAAPENPLDACSPAPGVGVARVDTARGTLLHRVRLEGERVAEYSVVAPTEWNFHPRGPFASQLVGAPAADAEALHRLAAALALALDPCVPHQLEVAYA